MYRLHLTLGMLDCLDDIIEIVMELPDEKRRGVDERKLLMLQQTVYEKKLGIDRPVKCENSNEGESWM